VYARGPADDPAALDAEQTLYGGPFLSNDDRRRLERLRLLDGAALAEQRPVFDDGRLDDLLLRYRARNWPNSLNEDEQAQWLSHCRARLHEGKGGHRTVAQVLERIDELAEQRMAAGDERGQAVLEALVDWVEAVTP